MTEYRLHGQGGYDCRGECELWTTFVLFEATCRMNSNDVLGKKC